MSCWRHARRFGVTVAMDNYFTSAPLLPCLLDRRIFSAGTVRGKRLGLDGAEALWKAQKKTAKDKNDMPFARNGELPVVKWVDSKVGYLYSTRHIFQDGFEGLNYE